ncbi:hypothetical protein [Paenibacillus sp. PDC88]|uniref:hypothetical protein n=1 Tax=Paenibacillus sp. PDC88 TaxID=1884375 RepID=UPI000898D172|nr:hypothetical protein [Paenibacillus sp. PDC88]SDW30762.1 hypothetical protein SAMN05518848_101955 [Paenibacillus sp. PDC88]
MEIVFGFLSIIVVAFLFLRMRDQDRQICDLLDRLAARSHAEYVATKAYNERPPEDNPPDRLSWYDDPIEGDGK